MDGKPLNTLRKNWNNAKILQSLSWVLQFYVSPYLFHSNFLNGNLKIIFTLKIVESNFYHNCANMHSVCEVDIFSASFSISSNSLNSSIMNENCLPNKGRLLVLVYLKNFPLFQFIIRCMCSYLHRTTDTLGDFIWHATVKSCFQIN